MDQKPTLLFVFVAIVIMFGLIIFDFVANNRIEKITGGKSNWQWSDDWQNDSNNDNNHKVQSQPRQQLSNDTYQGALQQAAELKMPVLIIFEAEWCQWCKKFHRETITNPQVKEALKPYVVHVLNTDQNPSIAKKFGIRQLPSYVITNASEKKLKYGTGYKVVPHFIEWLDNPDLYEQL